jgi:glutamate-ammonia-ligase adenylyltransferase
VIDALRDLHRQIRAHAQRQSVGRPERANDVKLGRGGIREIEFTVQMLQVVRGGQFPELRMRPTLAALPALVQARLMPPETAEALAQAYVFLRRVEHRVQYLDDKQTHVLPTDENDLHWIAQSMALPDAESLATQLADWRDKVAQEFERLLRPAESEQSDTPQTAPSADMDSLLEPLNPALPAGTETITLPALSVRVIKVLLKVDLMKALPS